MTVDECNEADRVGTVSVWIHEGLYVVEDDETGISSQGPTKAEALRNLSHALESFEAGTEGNDDWL